MGIETLIIAILLFLALYLGYREGLKLGMTTSKGAVPKSPIRVVTEAVESHTTEAKVKEAEQELDNIMSATKESMLEAMKMESLWK